MLFVWFNKENIFNKGTHVMSKQSGSAHVAIVAVSVVALLGVLGFILWQNYINKKISSTNLPVVSKSEQRLAEPMLKFSTWNVEIQKDESSMKGTIYENYDFEFAAVRSDDEYTIYSVACNGHSLGVLSGSEKMQTNTVVVFNGKSYNFEQAIDECPSAATSTSGKDANVQLNSTVTVLKDSLKTMRLIE